MYGFVLKDFTANYSHIEVHKQQDYTNCRKYNTRERKKERERERERELERERVRDRES